MLCREFGWTYSELMEAPQEFVDDCVQFICIEREEQQREAKRAQMKAKRRR